MRNVRTDSQTGQVTREIVFDGWVTTQVSQADGTWWNIRVERVSGR